MENVQTHVILVLYKKHIRLQIIDLLEEVMVNQMKKI